MEGWGSEGGGLRGPRGSEVAAGQGGGAGAIDIVAYRPRDDNRKIEKRSREMKRGEEEGYKVAGRSERRAGLMLLTRFGSPSCQSSSKDVGQLIIPTRFFVAFSSFLSACGPTVSVS